MPRMSEKERERQCKNVVERIDAYTAACRRKTPRMEREQIAASLGFNYVTLWSRLKHPEMFTFRELQNIASVLNITVATLIGDRAALELELEKARAAGRGVSRYV